MLIRVHFTGTTDGADFTEFFTETNWNNVNNLVSNMNDNSWAAMASLSRSGLNAACADFTEENVKL